MQQEANPLSSLKNMSWLELLEVATLIGVIGCGVTAGLTKKAEVAIAPIPVALALNWVNRSRSLQQTKQKNNASLSQLGHYAKANFDILASKMQNLEEVTIPSMANTSSNLETSLGQLSGQFQNLSSQLSTMEQLNMDERVERSQLVDRVQKQVTQIRLLRDDLTELQEFTTSEVEDQGRQRKEMLGTLEEKINAMRQAGVSEKQAQKATLNKLNLELEKLEKTVAGALHKQKEEQDQQLLELGQQLTYAQDLIDKLQQQQGVMEANTDNLAHQQQEMAEVVNCLKDIENSSSLIEVKANLDSAYYQRAANHQKLNDEASALVDYNRAIEANPKHARSYFNRALILETQGNKQSAVNDYRKAAQYFLEEGDVPSYQAAKDKTKEFLDLPPGNEQDEVTSSTLVKGLFDEAELSSTTIKPLEDRQLSKFEKLISEEHLDEKINSATAQDVSKPTDLKEYNQLIADDPHNAQALFERGLLLEAAGDKQRAVEDFRVAAKIFLEEGDISSYQTARDKNRGLLEIAPEPEVNPEADGEEGLELMVEGLFN